MPIPTSPHPTLSREALELIYAHARNEYPGECCGIVSGPRGLALADRVTACVNIQDQLHARDPLQFIRDAGRAYRMASEDVLLLVESLDGDMPAQIVYHSHVDVGAYFSQTDQAAAVSGTSPTYPVEYLVVDIRADGPHGAIQFAWDGEAKRYQEVGNYP